MGALGPSSSGWGAGRCQGDSKYVFHVKVFAKTDDISLNNYFPPLFFPSLWGYFGDVFRVFSS